MTNWNDLLFYLLLWAIFGIIHSLLASTYLKSKIRLNPQPYRILYVIISILTFIPISIYNPSLSSTYTDGFSISGLRFILFLLFFISGLIILLIGILAWDLFGFIGLKPEDGPLNIGGIYRLSRHPVYTGGLFVFISTLFVEISEASLSWVLGAGGYFILGSIPEELKLNDVFEEYKAYKRNVGRFFPWKKQHWTYLLNR